MIEVKKFLARARENLQQEQFAAMVRNIEEYEETDVFLDGHNMKNPYELINLQLSEGEAVEVLMVTDENIDGLVEELEDYLDIQANVAG